jgi:hypothetical protein
MKSDREIFNEIAEEQRLENDINLLLESYPIWVKGAVLLLVNKIRTADTQIRQTNDTAKKLDLMSQQIKWSAYMNGLAIGFASDDKSLQSRLRGMR